MLGGIRLSPGPISAGFIGETTTTRHLWRDGRFGGASFDHWLREPGDSG